MKISTYRVASTGVEIIMNLLSQPEVVEVLRVLALDHKSIRGLVLAVLHERHSLPEWTKIAIESGWSPPGDWFKQEQDALRTIIRTLLDRRILFLNRNWKLQRSNPVAMQIIAEQAS